MNDVDHRFPCDACGADLRFNPELSRLVCDHCGHTAEIEGVSEAPPLREIDFESALDGGGAEYEETRVLNCTNCGASVEFDERIHAAECPFCATPVVTGTGAHRHIKPGGLVPFRLAEEEARKAMSDWLGRLWFAPNGLQAYARKGRRIEGIYAPYWTYDADTRSRYKGQRGTEYTETRTVERNGKRETQRVTKVRWRPVEGRVARFFDDVLVLASRALPKRFTDALAPWDLTELRPYTPELLAGFRAEGYTVSLEDGMTEAREIMDRQILRDIRFDIGGDRQRVSHVDTSVRAVTFKHLLLPVWVAAYKYRGQSYRFVVNGQSGRVSGERPWSAWKIAFAVTLGLLVAGAVGYAIALNEGAL